MTFPRNFHVTSATMSSFPLCFNGPKAQRYGKWYWKYTPLQLFFFIINEYVERIMACFSVSFTIHQYFRKCMVK